MIGWESVCEKINLKTGKDRQNKMVGAENPNTASDLTTIANEGAALLGDLSTLASKAPPSVSESAHNRNDKPPVKRLQPNLRNITRTRNRRGKAFTPLQYSALLLVLAEEPYPNREQLTAISRYVNLAPDRVKVWFQNARVRGAPIDVRVVPLAVTGAQILDGTAPANAQMSIEPDQPRPIHTRSVQDAAVQVNIIPPVLIDLYHSGALNTLINSTASLIGPEDYATMKTSLENGPRQDQDPAQEP